MKFYYGIIQQANKNGCYYLFRNTIIDNSDLLLLSKRSGITFSVGCLLQGGQFKTRNFCLSSKVHIF